MIAASSWIGSLTGGGACVADRPPVSRVHILFDKLPDVFTSKDVLKFYAPATTFRYTKLLVELGLVTREYKRLPTNGMYCVYTKK